MKSTIKVFLEGESEPYLTTETSDRFSATRVELLLVMGLDQSPWKNAKVVRVDHHNPWVFTAASKPGGATHFTKDGQEHTQKWYTLYFRKDGDNGRQENA